MTDGVHDLLDAHACACNGRAWETLRPFWAHDARAEVDGEPVGTGPKAVASALQAAWDEGLVARVMDVGGSRALVGYDGPEGSGRPRVMVQLHTSNGRVAACSVERLAGLA